jgi:hypothetical protein
MMIGRMIGAFGADDVAPAKVQKTTFSDDRRHLGLPAYSGSRFIQFSFHHSRK